MYLKRLCKTRWVAKCIQHNSNLERKFILFCCCFIPFYLYSRCSLVQCSYMVVVTISTKCVPGIFYSLIIARICMYVMLLPTPSIGFHGRKNQRKTRKLAKATTNKQTNEKKKREIVAYIAQHFIFICYFFCRCCVIIIIIFRLPLELFA